MMGVVGEIISGFFGLVADEIKKVRRRRKKRQLARKVARRAEDWKDYKEDAAERRADEWERIRPEKKELDENPYE